MSAPDAQPDDPSLDQFAFDKDGKPLTEFKVVDGMPSIPTMPRQVYVKDDKGPAVIQPFGTIDPWERGEHRASMRPEERELIPIRSIYADDEVDADPKAQTTKQQHPSES